MFERSFIVPEKLVTHFHIRPGDTVGDFGAGTGNFAAVLSRAVGPTGRVYACEIQRNLVETLAIRIRREHLTNVEVVWSDIEAFGGTKLESGALDSAILINTLFQSDDRAAALREINRTLRVGGKLLLVDWSESWGGVGPHPNNVLSLDEAKALAETAGFTFEREFEAGGHHYGLSFKKQ